MAQIYDLHNVKNTPSKIHLYDTVPIRINNDFSYLPQYAGNRDGIPDLLSNHNGQIMVQNLISVKDLQHGIKHNNKNLHIYFDQRMRPSTRDDAYNTLSQYDRTVNLPNGTKTMSENYLYPYHQPHKMLKNSTMN